jgi:hypothetical protein
MAFKDIAYGILALACVIAGIFALVSGLAVSDCKKNKHVKNMLIFTGVICFLAGLVFFFSGSGEKYTARADELRGRMSAGATAFKGYKKPTPFNSPSRPPPGLFGPSRGSPY